MITPDKSGYYWCSLIPRDPNCPIDQEIVYYRDKTDYNYTSIEKIGTSSISFDPHNYIFYSYLGTHFND
jgi:hypothetical protein